MNTTNTLNLTRLSTRDSTLPLVTFGLFMLLTIFFLHFGRDFSHIAPAWIWGVYLLASFYGVIISSRFFPKVISWGLPAVLVLRFLVDLLDEDLSVAFKTKTIQRFVCYLFVFLPWAFSHLSFHLKLRFPSLSLHVNRWLPFLTILALSLTVLGVPVFEHGCHIPLLSLIALFSIDQAKASHSIGHSCSSKLDKLDSWLTRSSPFLCFLLGGSIGNGRSLLIATLLSFSYLLMRYLKNTQTKEKLILLASFLGGLVLAAVLGNSDVFLRIKFTFSSFITSILATYEQTGSLYHVLPADDSTAASTNLLWRLLVWKDALILWAKAPFLGIGFKAIFSSASVALAYPNSVPAFEDLDLHNSWLQVLLRGGLFVFIPFVSYWWATFRSTLPESRPLITFFLVYSLGVVSFETPHYAIPAYSMISLIPILITKSQ